MTTVLALPTAGRSKAGAADNFSAAPDDQKTVAVGEIVGPFLTIDQSECATAVTVDARIAANIIASQKSTAPIPL